MNESPAQGGRRLRVALLLGLTVLAVTAAPAEAQRRGFPVESLGSRGANIVALQHLLRAAGHELPADGVFDETTQAAVGAFQEAAGLPVSGVVDAATWQALAPALEEGSAGQAVTAAQWLLNAKAGADLALSGWYDAPTRIAVEAFQRTMGIERSGVVDTRTWRDLLWHFVRPRFRDAPMCDYHSGNGKAANWGTSATVAQLEEAAALFEARTGLPTSVGELGFRFGGPIAGHSTHQVGLDVDLGLIRRDGRHCRRLGLDYRQAQYDRQMTRELIRAIFDAAPGRVKLIYFNDPVLVREGLVVRYPNHDHHLHVRYCEVGHAQPRYRCAAPQLPPAGERAALLEAAARVPLNMPRTIALDLSKLRF